MPITLNSLSQCLTVWVWWTSTDPQASTRAGASESDTPIDPLLLTKKPGSVFSQFAQYFMQMCLCMESLIFHFNFYFHIYHCF